MKGLAEAIADPDLKGVFESQAVENRSHVNMGRRIVEEFVAKPVDAELCRWACAVAKPVEQEMCRWACATARQDYRRFLHELGDFVLRRETPPPPVARVRVTD